MHVYVFLQENQADVHDHNVSGNTPVHHPADYTHHLHQCGETARSVTYICFNMGYKTSNYEDFTQVNSSELFIYYNSVLYHSERVTFPTQKELHVLFGKIMKTDSPVGSQISQIVAWFSFVSS